MGETTIQSYTLAFVWAIVILALGIPIYVEVMSSHGVPTNTNLDETQLAELNSSVNLLSGDISDYADDGEAELDSNTTIDSSEGNSLIAGWGTAKKLMAINNIRRSFGNMILNNGLLWWVPNWLKVGIILTLIIISLLMFLSFFRGYKAN